MNDEMDITNACEKHVISKDKIHKTMREVYNNFVLEPGVVLYCYQIAKQLFLQLNQLNYSNLRTYGVRSC